MDLITIDFETFYSKKYSLSKLTTEEYVRGTKFEVIGVSVKLNAQPAEWASGTHEEIKGFLATFDWKNAMVIAHNTMFDGAIMSWIFGIQPKAWADTLCMARAIHGVEVGGSLRALSERYNIGVKGTEVIDALSKRREDFTPEELSRYGDYCINDVELTHKLFLLLARRFPKTEMKLVDMTLRMYLHPTLRLDLDVLKSHLDGVKAQKGELLEHVAPLGIDRDKLMSNQQFAQALETLGVTPPMKTSLTTGKETYAFAKTDEGFKALQTHEDVRVQALVTARLGTKSTLEETRTQRFIDIWERGARFRNQFPEGLGMVLPVPIKYYAAHTGRWGGSDKINLQNLPSRGPHGKKLKSAIIAPPEHVLIDTDSSQIEARVLAWFAEQGDLIEAFEKGDDVYKKMASAIYGKPIDQISKSERFVGKTTILGCGYGMGAMKFQSQLKTFGVDVDLEEARRIVGIYRDTNIQISKVWREAHMMVKKLVLGFAYDFGKEGVLSVSLEESGLLLPSGMYLRYDDLTGAQEGRGIEYTYKVRRGRNKIYGGKVIENVCQALARSVIGHQMLLIQKKYPIALTVHDSVVCAVPETEVGEAREYIEGCMRTVPDWAEGLPVDCESSVGVGYGDCE